MCSYLYNLWGMIVLIWGMKKRQVTKQERAIKYQKMILKKQLEEELEQAKRELSVAEYHFNNCDKVYFDVANKQLTVAREKLDMVLMKSKLLAN